MPALQADPQRVKPPPYQAVVETSSVSVDDRGQSELALPTPGEGADTAGAEPAGHRLTYPTKATDYVWE